MKKSFACKNTALIELNQKLTFVNKFKPKATTLFSLLRLKEKSLRQTALLCFHKHYSQDIEELNDLNIWLAGSLSSHKLIDIRNLCKQQNAKVVTRLSAKVNLVVVGDKTKIEVLPEEIKVISAIEFEKILNILATKTIELLDNKNKDDEIIELLFSNELPKIESAFQELETQGISLKVLPLILAIFKIHKEKHIRYQAKKLILKETNNTAKQVMLFCETRNFMNAKYTVGMEDLAKITGFKIELFLYYLVLNQKNNLGKEYLASLNSDWTQKLIEEQELLNKKELTLYGKAGLKFVHAKNIESLTVHATSPVLWEMSWLKSLEIIDLKEKIELAKTAHFTQLESLTLETKELRLRGTLPITNLILKKCKKLTIDESFEIPNIRTIKLEACSFDLKVFKLFLESAELAELENIEIHNFISYRIPKGFGEELKLLLPNVQISF